MRLRGFVFLLAPVISLSLPLMAIRNPSATPGFTIIHVRVIDGTGTPPLENQDVAVVGDKIVSIHASTDKLPNGHVVDGTGRTLIPGLINAHGHLALVDGTKNSADFYTEPHVIAELRQYESYGVLHMLSLGLNRDLIYDIRTRQQQGTLDGAEAFSADRGIGVNVGAPPIPHQPDQLYQPQTPEEAREDVRAAASRHTNFIKIWVDDLYGTKPKMDPAIYRAVIDEAHKNHIKVAAHVYALADAKQLVADGVDVLAHSVRDTTVDAELLSAMKARGVYYLPTLTVDESFFAFADHPEILREPFFQHAVSPELVTMLGSEAYRQKVATDPLTARHRQDFANAEKNLKLVYDSGVKVGFGTDSGAMPTRVPGYAEHHELAMMVASGLTPLEAIRCATLTDATLLGIADRTGTIAAGKQADMILLNGNPVDDIKNTEKIEAIWHNGHTVTTATPH
jgi:imidazolonepropionase-like amidohydrolase